MNDALSTRQLLADVAEDLGTLEQVTVEGNDSIEAYGVKGMNNTRWRKTFKNREALDRWAEENDAEIQGTRKAGSDSVTSKTVMASESRQLIDIVLSRIREGKHKPGCKCGFCKNKGSFGKKKEKETEEPEKGMTGP